MSLLNNSKEGELYISTWKTKHPIPHNLESCSIEEFEIILKLSSEALKTLREQTTSLQLQEILNKKICEMSEQKKEELSRLQREYEGKINNLKFSHSNNEEKNQQRYSNEIHSLQSRISELQLALEQSVKSYQMLNNNFLNLQSSSNEYMEKNISVVLDKQKQVYQEQLTIQEKIYKEQISGLKSSVDALTNRNIQENIPSLKGKVGETSFDNLVQNFTTWEIEDTSKVPQSCDRFGNIRGCKTLFEIKNYSHNVPKKETDKFKRDLEIHNDCPLGIFISLETNIVGGPQDFFYTEFTSSNQLLIYIQKFNNHDHTTIFSILNTLIDIALLFYNKTLDSNKDTNIQDKIDSIKPILQCELTNLSTFVNELTNNKKFLLDTITKQFNSTKHHIDKIRCTFESLIKVLFDDVVVSENLDEEGGEEIPLQKKRRNTSKAKLASSTS
jgi:hypothetical protein